MGWDYNSHIVCMCIIMRWSRNRSASWAERFRTSPLLCTYKLCDYYSRNRSASWAERFRTSLLLCTCKLCDYYSLIPILSPFLFTPSLYVAILNLQDFLFTCNIRASGDALCRDGQGEISRERLQPGRLTCQGTTS